MALTTISPLLVNITQPLTTNLITTNYTTLPFLTLGNGTTDLPFLEPDPSLFSTDLPSFLLNETLSSNFIDENSNGTSTDYETVIANDTSLYDTTYTEEEEVNPFLAGDYNFYDYNPYDPNATFDNEPYDYSTGSQDSGENDDDDDVMRLWDGVDVPPPIRPIAYDALTDLNPWFLWTPPIICLLSLVFVVLPCIIYKLKDDMREKKGLSRIYGPSRRRSMIQKEVIQQMRVGDLERQAAAASSSLPRPHGDPYSDIQYAAHGASNGNGVTKSPVKNGGVSPGHVSENVLYIEETELSKKKTNGVMVSKRLAVDEPPVHYKVGGEVLVTHQPRTSSKEAGGDENLELHRHSSSSGSVTPAEGGSGETSLGSSSGPERRADEDSDEEGDQVAAHRNGNFSTAPKAYSKLTGWNRDMYSNGAGFGPPARTTSVKDGEGNPPEETVGRDWGMY